MKAQTGFGFIKVMIALMIMALAAGSLLQLSKNYLNYSREGRSREQALRLLESKLDHMRTAHTLAEYTAISSGSAQQTLGQLPFTLVWTVTEFSWESSTQQWQSGATDPQLSKKDIVVQVNWQDGHAELQVLTLASSVTFIGSLTAGPFGVPGAASAAP